MSPAPAIRKHNDAVIAALVAAGLTIGDGEAPEADPPYGVVYQVPSAGLEGTLADPNADGELVYQVTCVGTTREQAQWVVDKAMALLDGFNVANRSIARVSVDSLPGVLRDDKLDPPLFYATPRFRVFSTPAS